jgi:coproporphyrinogen III oxidase-like Fe-S oxidoreductase
VAKGEETRADRDDGAVETRLAEALVTALRLADGADLDAIGDRYGVDLWARHRADLDELARRGWADLRPPRVRLTERGILWSLEALAPFVADRDDAAPRGTGPAMRAPVPS